jgi:CDP-paratose 2-epimerase
VPEEQPLDFHTPYACSKGAADQYVRDYARIYGLDTVVFRQSCIYGTRQFGVEDQGWVAHFVISILLGRPLNIFGNGKQVRDVLFIDDLTRLMDLAYRKRDTAAGGVYNVGGGPENTLSLMQLIKLMEELTGKKVDYAYKQMRTGDQLMFIADISRADRDFNWRPAVGPREGVEKLCRWVEENMPLFKRFYSVP